jgi:hypothetical protein
MDSREHRSAAANWATPSRRGERLFLRPLDASDVAQEYLSWSRDDEVTRFLEVDGKSLTVAKVVDYDQRGPQTRAYLLYAICDGKTIK